MERDLGMDLRLRTLQREAMAGSLEALQAFCAALGRAGILPPIQLPQGVSGALESAHGYHGTPAPDAPGISWLWGEVEYGSYAEESVSALGRDERGYFCVSGSCDTTGWDCQSGADQRHGPTLWEAVAYLSQEQRVSFLRGVAT